MKPSGMFIDGATYVLIAFCTAMSAAFGTDEAAKYISPVWLFWLRLIFNSFGASLLALKMYRSTGFADHKAKQNGNTEIINKP